MLRAPGCENVGSNDSATRRCGCSDDAKGAANGRGEHEALLAMLARECHSCFPLSVSPVSVRRQVHASARSTHRPRGILIQEQRSRPVCARSTLGVFGSHSAIVTPRLSTPRAHTQAAQYERSVTRPACNHGRWAFCEARGAISLSFGLHKGLRGTRSFLICAQRYVIDGTLP